VRIFRTDKQGCALARTASMRLSSVLIKDVAARTGSAS
jgi:hypothetical protein